MMAQQATYYSQAQSYTVNAKAFPAQPYSVGPKSFPTQMASPVYQAQQNYPVPVVENTGYTSKDPTNQKI